MNMLWVAFVSVTLPWILIVLPGLFFLDESLPFVQRIGRIVLGGLTLTTLFFSLVVTLRLPLVPALLLGIAAVFLFVLRRHGKQLRRQRYVYLGAAAVLLLVYGLFSIPFLSYHQGLPTGDAQKAIYWAQSIITTQSWPTYTDAFSQLNRDPVDFYTPGLHAVTAALLASTPGVLIIVGFFSIAAALVVAVEAAALTSLLLPTQSRWWAVVAVVLVLSHERFLRYIREPGYHLQNVVGEVFLWGLVLLALSLMQRWRWRDAVLVALTGIALVLSHQFSSFVAIFVVVAMTVGFMLTSRALLRRVWTHYRTYAFFVVLLLVILLIGGLFSSLASKLPHLFTRSPHLAGLMPSPLVYLQLAGPLYLGAGIAGWLAAVVHRYRSKLSTAAAVSFALGGSAILLLSVGPLLGIDIPPVRALFYSVVPLSCGVVLLLAFSSSLLKRPSRFVVAVVVAGCCYAGVTHAFTLSHAVRTNATLSPGQQFLISALSSQPGGIVVDEFNRASDSWLLLTHQPLFARIAADLHQQMNEAQQSTVRKQLYENQLDFEKIYNVGSLPVITHLLAKQHIRWVVGVDGATNWALAHNPALQPVWSADDITAYTVKPHFESPAAAPWLLQSTTILQDIGSDEDIFEHVPASVDATRLSTPQLFGQTTYRETTAPLIRLRFNVGDFVDVLWDTNHDARPDMDLQLVLKLIDHPQTLRLSTNNGVTLPIAADTSTLHLASNDMLIDDDGFITLTLQNPTQQMVQLDFMALGLCQNSPC